MIAVDFKECSKCVKLDLPNGCVVDILDPVVNEIHKWIQDQPAKPESGGLIVGYEHQRTGNISLEAVSTPCNNDIRTRVRFEMRDPQHKSFLLKAKKKKSYYMGAWHTHPQPIPVPSNTDWEDWKETLKLDKTGCRYVFFVIAGIKEWRLWAGDSITNEITEIHECKKNEAGLYLREELYQAEQFGGKI